MIFDLFLGYNEIELANFRVHYLSEHVKHTYIGESSLTHSGRPKPLYFSEWISKQDRELQSRVTVLQIPLNESDTAWEREIGSREFLANFAKNNLLAQKFILSDLDEIPSRNQLDLLQDSKGIFHFTTPTYYRKINWALADKHRFWSRGVMGDVDSLTMENGGRFSDLPLIGGVPGMHLSYLGLTAKGISEKLTSFAHTEYEDFLNLETQFLDYCDFYAIDHLGRVASDRFGLLELKDLKGLEIPEIEFTALGRFQDPRSKLPGYLKRVWASGVVTVFISRNQTLKGELSFSAYTSSYGFRFRVSILLLRILLQKSIRKIKGVF